MNTTAPPITLVILFLLSCITPLQADDFSTVEITTQKITDKLHMLQGKGGNIGVFTGEDGIFLVDDQFAPLTEKIKKSIAKLSDKEVRFIINTHYHFDHVGGNENFGKSGSVIVAHENVRRRMSKEQFITFFDNTIPPYPTKALPVITFSQNISFHLNGDDVEIFHIKEAHTDGDAVVFFKKANVIHTGDIYFAGIYPFIDSSANGSVAGVIRAVKTLLTMIDDDTKVIPGHGPLSNKEELTAYVQMLESLQKKMMELIAQGKTLDEIIALKPSQEFDTKWGTGFLKPEDFLRLLYEDLSKK